MSRSTHITGYIVGAAALALYLALSLAPAGGSASAVSRTGESFYYFQGKPVRLSMSVGELSVRFEGLSRTERNRVVRGLAGGMRLKLASGAGERGVYKLTWPGSDSLASSLARLEARREVAFAYPAFLSRAGQKLLLTDEIMVRLKGGRATSPIRRMLARRGLAIARKISYSSDEYVLKLVKPKDQDPLAVSRELYESGIAAWAEPNFIQELEKSYVPNDPVFAQEWHLANSGQGGGTINADARVSSAWDIERGKPQITIAVIDDGVEITHPDLVENIFTNRGERPENGIDDDLNGYIDDIHGWNFAAGDPDASPGGFFASGDDHGTAVAGVAAARGDNGIGVAGACPYCTILPVKITSVQGTWADDLAITEAIRYSGRMADVINISWGGMAPSASIQYALQYALTNGRNGKGALAFAASGNAASGIVQQRLSDLPPDTYRFRWVYSKNDFDYFETGEDAAWLAWVRFPGGETQSFENADSLPAGWTSGGTGGVPWSVVTDPVHSDEGRCWTRAARSGGISNSQETYLEIIKTTTEEGDFEFLGFVSSEVGRWGSINGDIILGPLDGLRLWIDRGNDGVYDWSSKDQLAGIPPEGPVYPAAYSQAVAVGATTNFDCRASYSQFGPELDLVAPSGGGSDVNPGLPTTDRTGSSGYDTGDYYLDFAGTSSATPLAAGIAGLVLSRNPGLTAAQVRRILESSADKVSPATGTYDDKGHSDELGHGRINARRALELTPAPASISFARPRYKVREGRAAKIQIRRSGNIYVQASVAFSAKGGSARAPSDFKAVSGRVRFAPGERVKTIRVPIRKDRIRERTERLNVRLSAPALGCVLAGPSQTKLSISDVRAKRLRSRSR